MLKQLQRFHRDERGMSLIWVGAGFMALMAATTLAIEVGMFMNARSQAQNAADAGALAGATALVYNDFNDRGASGPAVQSSVNTAELNKVMNSTVSVLPSDVSFPVDSYGRPNLVKVNVFRTTARDNPVLSLFGPLFGVPTVDIGATATAQAAPASGMTCVKPFIIPDKWEEKQDVSWAMDSTFHRYDNKGNLIANPDVYHPGQGYGEADRGTVLILRSPQGSNISPSMYYSWKMPNAIGGSFYEENIANCNTSIIELGHIANQEPGAMQGPTISGLKTLWDRDPSAYWDSGKKDYVSTQRPSPRVFPIPLYDPDKYEEGKQTGRGATLVVANWLGFFLEGFNGSEVYGRIFPITGVTAVNGPGPTAPLAYVIRLVE